MIARLKALLTPTFLRWFAVGVFFTGLGLVLLRITHAWGWSDGVATFVQAEICNVLRFLVVDRWVFQHPRPTWKRLWQYHVANAAGFVVWWSATNLMDRCGVNYLLAPVLGTIFSVGFSATTNFLWIWKKPKAKTG